MDGLAADGGGQRNNAQGRGEEEVVLGGGNNRNVREEEANLGQGAGRNVDPDEERMLCLMHALRVKVSIPVFKGDKNPQTPWSLRRRPWSTWMPKRSQGVNACLNSDIASKARHGCGMMKLPCPVPGMS